MAQLVREDSRSPIVRRAAHEAIAGAAGDPRGQAAAIHGWIRRHVRFVQDATLAGFSDDPDQAEVLIRPVDLLTMPQPKGDCDDFSMLAAAMLRSVGIDSAFKTVAAESGNPNYSHVYVLALLPDGQTPLDASHGPTLGWEVTAQGKSRLWPLDEAQMNRTLSGLGVDWTAVESIAGKALDTTSKILIPRLAVPQLNPGQYVQQGNQVMYQQPAGTSPLAFPGVQLGSNTGLGTIVLLGAAAVGLLLLVTRKGH
ncbi:MAG: transglutaminase-like domain-containing protein [Acidobacteriia bacterium]|nr:transglutaminase-like domain-containing protein [Terriglobia bacterium]